MARRTCGYCGDTGHNRSTCSTHKASIDKLRERDPENWRVASYDREQQSRKAKRRTAAENRRCSYCSGSGHNRRTCSTLSEHKMYANVANAEAREEILTYLRKEGIGPGALMVMSDRFFNSKTDEYERRFQTYVVAGMNWKALDFAYFDMGLSDNEHPDNRDVLSLVNLTTGQKTRQNLMSPEYMEKKKELVQAYREKGEVAWGVYSPIIVSPAESVTPPNGWLDSRDHTTLMHVRFGGKGKKATTKYDVRNRLQWDAVDQVIKRHETTEEES